MGYGKFAISSNFEALLLKMMHPTYPIKPYIWWHDYPPQTKYFGCNSIPRNTPVTQSGLFCKFNTYIDSQVK